MRGEGRRRKKVQEETEILKRILKEDCVDGDLRIK